MASTRPRICRSSCRCAGQTGASLVIGSRMHNARAIPWLRRQVNRWMSRQLSRCAGRCLPDTQCGFRLIHLATWAALPLQTRTLRDGIRNLDGLSCGGAAGRVRSRSGSSAAVAEATSVRWPTHCAGGNGGGISAGSPPRAIRQVQASGYPRRPQSRWKCSIKKTGRSLPPAYLVGL